MFRKNCKMLLRSNHAQDFIRFQVTNAPLDTVIVNWSNLLRGWVLFFTTVRGLPTYHDMTLFCTLTRHIPWLPPHPLYSRLGFHAELQIIFKGKVQLAYQVKLYILLLLCRLGGALERGSRFLSLFTIIRYKVIK